MSRLSPLISGTVPAIPLNRPVLLVGRHPECDVRIDMPQISRRHCSLVLANDRATIRDLGSRHGVRVNGRLVEEARLFPGDEVAIGHLLYRFEDQAPAPAPAPATRRPATADRQPEPWVSGDRPPRGERDFDEVSRLFPDK
jgi:hypothetical protein